MTDCSFPIYTLANWEQDWEWIANRSTKDPFPRPRPEQAIEDHFAEKYGAESNAHRVRILAARAYAEVHAAEFTTKTPGKGEAAGAVVPAALVSALWGVYSRRADQDLEDPVPSDLILRLVRGSAAAAAG